VWGGRGGGVSTPGGEDEGGSLFTLVRTLVGAKIPPCSSAHRAFRAEKPGKRSDILSRAVHGARVRAVPDDGPLSGSQSPRKDAGRGGGD